MIDISKISKCPESILSQNIDRSLLDNNPVDEVK